MNYKSGKNSFIVGLCLCFFLGLFQTALAGKSEFKIKDAKWDPRKLVLTVSGNGINGASVDVYDAADSSIGTATIERNRWQVTSTDPKTVTCSVTAIQTFSDTTNLSDTKDVNNKPDNCDDGGTENNAPVLKSIGNKFVTLNANLTFIVTASDDGLPAGSTLTISAVVLPDGSSFTDNGDGRGTFNWENANPVGETTTTFSVSDGDLSDSESISIMVTDTIPPPGSSVSINSTSQNGLLLSTSVNEQSLISNSNYQLFAVNDLGMHCGDFDTRISSILPPFNILHAQVIERGDEPNILGVDDGVSVTYTAASNPNDPILSGINSAGTAIIASGGEIIDADYPVLSSLTKGLVYKTNFWDIASGMSEPTALSAYRAFYPPGILDAFFPNYGLDDDGKVNIFDIGLPMPDVELLHLHLPPTLTATQQAMPGIMGPYSVNNRQEFNLFVRDQAFFVDPAFQFGYVSEGVDWFEAAGIPLTAFDDFGRENPWPLYRIQAVHNGTVVASTDTVVPISGEANCGFCHNDPDDGGNGEATDKLTDIALASDDPMYNKVPYDVSKEWAADLNLIRLHDLEHATKLEEETPVVCQSCHYTPALDLAQLGPRGPENDHDPILGNLANGRDQVKNKSMSNVMHSHHGQFTDLFPEMPAAEKDANGMIVNWEERRGVLEQTCYQCHPGRRTDCLRGAMANGGMLCQDCHGDMKQVGDDFSRNVSAINAGAFELGGDFYTNPDQPRVPWANEPGCGSCHTGDAMDNMTGTTGTVVNAVDSHGEIDGIRLFQAYLNDDLKATPIVPTNKRFAENVIEADNPAVLLAEIPDDPRIGNPMLYRVSKGHEGIFCEACHGATHGIWPNKNPNANDNVTAMQLQGHTGTISECDACHTGDLGKTLDGPHGMHPIGKAGVHFAEGGHGSMVEGNENSCRACHGKNGEGTVLSAMAQERTLKCKDSIELCTNGEVIFENDYQVGCTECHSNEL